MKILKNIIYKLLLFRRDEILSYLHKILQNKFANGCGKLIKQLKNSASTHKDDKRQTAPNKER